MAATIAEDMMHQCDSDGDEMSGGASCATVAIVTSRNGCFG